MLPKWLLVLTLFAALAVMQAHALRAQWVRTATLDSPNPRVLILSKSGSTVFAGIDAFEESKTPLFRTTNNGDTWEAADIGLPVWSVNSVLPYGGKLFCEAYSGSGGGVYSSTDDGLTWSASDSILGLGPGEDYTIGIRNALLAYGGQLFVIGGWIGGHIYCSTDTGLTWNERDSGINNTLPFFEVDALTAIGDTLWASANSYSDDRYLFGYLFQSTDTGKTWRKALHSPGYPVFILDTAGKDIFAAQFLTQAESPACGFYRSSDRGTTWDSVPIPTIPSNLCVNGTSLFASGDEANYFTGPNVDSVFYSNDTGTTWTLVSSGLPQDPVTALFIANGYLFAGTHDSGVWKRPLSDFGISSVAQRPTGTTPGIQVYPNPFSQSTNITFSSQASGYADVSIVNLLGAEVAHLFSGEVGAGEHSFVWDCRGAWPCAPTDGMYECLVRMNGRVETLPVMLAR